MFVNHLCSNGLFFPTLLPNSTRIITHPSSLINNNQSFSQFNLNNATLLKQSTLFGNKDHLSFAIPFKKQKLEEKPQLQLAKTVVLTSPDLTNEQSQESNEASSVFTSKNNHKVLENSSTLEKVLSQSPTYVNLQILRDLLSTIKQQDGIINCLSNLEIKNISIDNNAHNYTKVNHSKVGDVKNAKSNTLSPENINDKRSCSEMLSQHDTNDSLSISTEEPSLKQVETSINKVGKSVRSRRPYLAKRNELKEIKDLELRLEEMYKKNKKEIVNQDEILKETRRKMNSLQINKKKKEDIEKDTPESIKVESEGYLIIRSQPLINVGNEYQADIPEVNQKNNERRQRVLRPVWNPEIVEKNKVESFFEDLEALLGAKDISEDKALKLFLRSELDKEKALHSVRKNKTYYKNLLCTVSKKYINELKKLA